MPSGEDKDSDVHCHSYHFISSILCQGNGAVSLKTIVCHAVLRRNVSLALYTTDFYSNQKMQDYFAHHWLQTIKSASFKYHSTIMQTSWGVFPEIIVGEPMMGKALGKASLVHQVGWKWNGSHGYCHYSLSMMIPGYIN